MKKSSHPHVCRKLTDSATDRQVHYLFVHGIDFPAGLTVGDAMELIRRDMDGEMQLQPTPRSSSPRMSPLPWETPAEIPTENNVTNKGARPWVKSRI